MVFRSKIQFSSAIAIITVALESETVGGKPSKEVIEDILEMFDGEELRQLKHLINQIKKA